MVNKTDIVIGCHKSFNLFSVKEVIELRCFCLPSCLLCLHSPLKGHGIASVVFIVDINQNIRYKINIVETRKRDDVKIKRIQTFFVFGRLENIRISEQNFKCLRNPRQSSTLMVSPIIKIYQ